MVSLQVDLRSEFGPARDQGPRPTCLAFTTSDTHAGLRPSWTPLSCEYVFYHAQKRAGRPINGGAVLRFMLEAVRLDGQPAESQWPYSFKAAAMHGWGPPSGLSPLYARNGSVHGTDIPSILQALDDGVPVIILMTLSPSFFAPGAGGIVDLQPREVPEPSQRHAVIAVGYGQHGGETAILIRNSWGSDWGDGGHAWLTESYLAPRIFDSAILLEDVSVSASSPAA